MSGLLEAWFTGAEGVCPVDHTVGFVAITTLSPITPTIIQLRIC